ncbi:MAG: hypothetical protein ACK2UL_06855 [Anaerolineae bacterium]
MAVALSTMLAAERSSTAAPPAGASQDETREYVWLEGEDAARHTFNQHAWYSSTGVRLDVMSPGGPIDDRTDAPMAGRSSASLSSADSASDAPGWLAHYGTDGRTAHATYEFSVVHGGTYRLWLRTSVYQVRQWYRVDGGREIEMDLESDVRERINLTAPAGPDIRFLAWVKVADLELAAGDHTLTVVVGHHPDRQPGEVHGGIDAICLTNFPWAPAGALRPKLASAPEPAPDEWYPYIPLEDDFAASSVTDMSRLLDKPAGTHGPVRRAGDAVQFADGTPVKLWGVGASIPDDEQLMEQQARYYTKHGVNLVRLHPVESVVGLLVRDQGTGERRLDPARLAHLDRWFATLKSAGIYMAWSPYYPHVITPDDGYPAELYSELPDGSRGKSTSGYVGFMTELQDAEWTWLRELLVHRNVYTGLRYVDDPALAVVETHNEDSVFWHWPLNSLAASADAPRHTAALQGMWADWLGGRYADDTALLAAWGRAGSGSRSGDSLSNRSMPIYGAWEMAATGPSQNLAEKQRMGDFIRFLAETQRQYYERRESDLRDLGYAGLTVTTAWQAGGAAADAANLWTDDSAEAIDRHVYVGGAGRPEDVHRILPGPVRNETHLAAPGSGILAVGLQQVEDKPFVVSEWNQNPPNQWTAEAAPLMALFGLGLNGWDASIHFSSSHPRIESGWPDESSYSSDTPHYMGQFPALALAVHRGDIAEGALVAARRIATAGAFAGVDAFTQPLPGLGYGGSLPSTDLITPLETLAMGRVTAKVADGLPPSWRTDWGSYSDPTGDVLTSSTGQLEWDAQRGLVIVRADRTQGVVGFAGGDRHDVPAASLYVDTGFVSLLLTALDDRPLTSSGHVLVTALARDRQAGARYSTGADGQVALESLGGPPLLMEPVQATIAFSGAAVTSAVALDVNGVPTGRQVERSGNSIRLDGRYATHYYELKTVNYQPAPGTSEPPTPSATATGARASPTPAASPTMAIASRAFLPVAGTGERPWPDQPDRALADATWHAAERLMERYPPETMFPGYSSDLSGASARAAALNVEAACHDFPDLPDVFGLGVHRRACDGWVASYLGVFHAASSMRGESGEHLQWAGHYLDILLEVDEDFAFGPEDSRAGRGYRDSFAAMWQNPLRATDTTLLAELLRRQGALMPSQRARAAEVLSGMERAWLAEFWSTGVQPSTGVTLTIRTADEVQAYSLAGRPVVSTVPWAIAWDADDRNTPAEETAWMGAGAMLVGQALQHQLSDADQLYEAGAHYVDFSLVFDRPDPVHGGVVRTLNARTEGGPYGQRKYWLKNHAADAPAIPYVGSVWHSIGTALMASEEGPQEPWDSLAGSAEQWRVMLASVEESLLSPDGTFLIDMQPGSGIGYNLSRFPDWFSDCGAESGGRAYVQYDGRAGGRPLLLSEIGHPAGIDILAAGWPIMRLAAYRGDRDTYARWRGRVTRVLDEYSVTPPNPGWATCKFAPYVSDNRAYHWSRWLSAYVIAYVGLSGVSVDAW